MSERWPWPGDTPLDRARRIARSYRDALHVADHHTCAYLDQRARDLGQGWIVPKPLGWDRDDLLTQDEVADMCDVRLATVRQWRHRGMPTVDTADGLRYRVADVLDYHAQRRRRRAEKHDTPTNP